MGEITTPPQARITCDLCLWLWSYKLPCEALVSRCTDKGLFSICCEISCFCPIFHCILHRRAVGSKRPSEDLGNTLETFVQAVNFIKAHSPNQRLFAQLCGDEAYQTLMLHTDVRWLQHGQELMHFMKLQEKKLLEDHNNHCANMWLMCFRFNWHTQQTHSLSTLSVKIN